MIDQRLFLAAERRGKCVCVLSLALVVHRYRRYLGPQLGMHPASFFFMWICLYREDESGERWQPIASGSQSAADDDVEKTSSHTVMISREQTTSTQRILMRAREQPMGAWKDVGAGDSCSRCTLSKRLETLCTISRRGTRCPIRSIPSHAAVAC